MQRMAKRRSERNGVARSVASRGGLRGTCGWNAVAFMIGVLFLVPFVWLIVTAFVRYGGLNLSVAGGFTAGNFSRLFGGSNATRGIGEGVGRALLNSLYLSGGTMLFTTVVALLAAYPLARFRIPGRNLLVYGIVFVTGLPVIAVVIPTYDIFIVAGFVDSRLWTVLFMTATSLPFAVWMGRNFIENVPIELEEAAMTEGAGIRKILRFVTVPLIVPGTLVIAIYTFINSWSNFFVPFILLQIPREPAAVTIYQFFGEHTIDFSGLAAFSLIFTAVPVTLYIILSRRAGGTSMFAGAVKG